MQKLEYLIKQEKPLFSDLYWNIPEQKTGKVTIVGGNSQNFANIIRTAENLEKEFPIKTLNIILPDSLRGKVPPLTNITLAPATSSGSFDRSATLNLATKKADAGLILGDLSKNSITAVAIIEAIKETTTPFLLTRDTVDLVAADAAEIIEKENLWLFASVPQLQKLLRSIYYPKMILMSMPLLAMVEVLHKFTLSYPITIITLHQGQIIVAAEGKIILTPLKETEFSPLSIWSGKLAGRILALNLYNPKKKLKATAAGLLKRN